MKLMAIITIFAVFLTSSIYADENKTLSKREMLIAKLKQSTKKRKEQKKKLTELKELRKSVDRLASTIVSK